MAATKRTQSIALSWSAESGRYRGADGRFVPRTKVASAIDIVVEDSRQHFRTISNRLLADKIGIGDWQEAIRERLHAAHTLVSAVAGGGKANMTPAKWGKLGVTLREQYKYLQRFALELEAGRPINLGRVDMYARAIGITFQNAERLNYPAGQRAQWVRTSREGCAGCLAQAERGVQLVADFPPIGSRQCLVNCGCYLKLQR